MEYSPHSDQMWAHSTKYCQSHKTMLWIWIMLCPILCQIILKNKNKNNHQTTYYFIKLLLDKWEVHLYVISSHCPFSTCDTVISNDTDSTKLNSLTLTLNTKRTTKEVTLDGANYCTAFSFLTLDAWEVTRLFTNSLRLEQRGQILLRTALFALQS